MSATERIYIGRDNEAKVRFRVPGLANPLQGVTRMTVALDPAGITVDSAVNADRITWTADGSVTLKLGAVAATGTQQAIVTAYDPDHTGGQVYAHPEGDTNRLVLEFLS